MDGWMIDDWQRDGEKEKDEDWASWLHWKLPVGFKSQQTLSCRNIEFLPAMRNTVIWQQKMNKGAWKWQLFQKLHLSAWAQSSRRGARVLSTSPLGRCYRCHSGQRLDLVKAKACGAFLLLLFGDSVTRSLPLRWLRGWWSVPCPECADHAGCLGLQDDKDPAAETLLSLPWAPSSMLPDCGAGSPLIWRFMGNDQDILCGNGGWRPVQTGL